MRIKILCVGKIKDRALLSKTEEYLKRIKHDCSIEITEIKDSDMESEGKRIRESISRDSRYIVALGEEGRQYSSKDFAFVLCRHPEITLIIGGPSGLSDTVKKSSNELLSLSRMTFTHEMARLFLIEQIYRAISIINNRKYHKE